MRSRGFIFPAIGWLMSTRFILMPRIDSQASLESVPKSTQASMRGRIDLYGKNYNWITRADAEKPGDDVLLNGWNYPMLAGTISELGISMEDLMIEEYALKVA